MSPKKYMSTKKTLKQTISISPELKERINNYVKKKRKENPNMKKYRSISSYYTKTMEIILKYLESGKSLEDLTSFPDVKVDKFFKSFSFKGLMPVYDEKLEANRYNPINFESTAFFLLSARNLYLNNMNLYDLSSMKKFFDKMGKYFESNNITRKFTVTFKVDRTDKYYEAVFEHSAYYRNLQYENMKYIAFFLGYLGVELKDYYYSPKSLYCRMDLKIKSLFYDQKTYKQERIELGEKNLSKFLDFENILWDEDYHLWMKMAHDKDIYISFRESKNFEQFLKQIEAIKGYESNENQHLLRILQFFEKIHWIEIHNERELAFRIIISEDENPHEIELIKNILSISSDSSKIGENYYLKR